MNTSRAGWWNQRASRQGSNIAGKSGMIDKFLRRHLRQMVASVLGFGLAGLCSTVHADGNLVAMVSGSGQTTVEGELRTFSFVAQQDESGNTVGMAQVNNRLVGEMFHLDVDCLNVIGDLAIVSGVITRHTDEHAIGLTGIFAVVDGGEGAAAPPDLITQVFFFQPGVLTCSDLGPDDAAPFLVPIEAGNVQVH